MKKAYTLLLIIVAIVPVFSQSWSFGLRGSANSTWLLNKNITDSKDQQTYSLGLGPNGGIEITAHFNEYVGLQVNCMYGIHTQAYNFVDSSNGASKLTVAKTKNTLTTIDIPALLYIEMESGGYLELGPQFSLIQAATYQDLDGNTWDATKYFAKNNLAGVLGVGMAHSINDNLFLKVGFRFSYGFTDLKGVDGKGRDLNRIQFYRTANPTNSAFGGVHLSFYYKTSPKGRHRGGPGKRRRA